MAAPTSEIPSAADSVSVAQAAAVRAGPAHFSSPQRSAGREAGIASMSSALRELTDSSGGRTEIVRSSRDLDPATTSIADELSQQYDLGYSSPGQRDGRWHSIRVEVRDRSLRVRARRGYLATS